MRCVAPRFGKLACLSEAREAEFIQAVDINRARAARIRPLASHRIQESTAAEQGTAAPAALPRPLDLGLLPGELANEAPATPFGRVERWQRKLLDLSLGNRLLNFRDTRGAIAMTCPDISGAEDRLANGETFRLLALKDENAVSGRDLSPDEVHQIELSLARDALSRGQIAVPLTAREMTNRLTELYRKARSDMAEGGTNTSRSWSQVPEPRGSLPRLPSAYRDDNLPAKQFDLLVLSAQLALLEGDAGFARAQTRIREVASGLESLSNIPLVAKQLDLILEVQDDAFWIDITVDMLDEVRRKLRLLVELINPAKRKVVITDFEDEIGIGQAVVLPQVGAGVDKARFLQKARRFVEKHRDHITMLKVRKAEQLTRQDLEVLESMFVAEGVADPDGFQDAVGEAGLGVFLRSLTGLDRVAAKQIFSDFTSSSALTANQTEFVDLIIDSLTESGFVDPALFYESPFTDFDDMGISGMFKNEDVKAIVEIVQRINASAAA